MLYRVSKKADLNQAHQVDLDDVADPLLQASAMQELAGRPIKYGWHVNGRAVLIIE